MQNNVHGVSAGASKMRPVIIFLHVDFRRVVDHLLLGLVVGVHGVGNVVKNSAEFTSTRRPVENILTPMNRIILHVVAVKQTSNRIIIVAVGTIAIVCDVGNARSKTSTLQTINHVCSLFDAAP